MLGTTDWLLKRFLKFILKRNVGKYLTSEIDLEQLDVKLDTGKLELKNLLLNCDAVNKDLALDGWHVKAGYVGSVNAKLPSLFSSCSQCSVLVNEVMLTVAPAPAVQSTAVGSLTPGMSATVGSVGPATAFPQDITASKHAAPPPAQSTSAAGAMNFLLADDFGWTGHGAVMDGIKRIAGSLQSLLQHMRVEASDILIRVELPHPTEKSRVVTAALKLDLVEFGDITSTPAASPSSAGSAVTLQQYQNDQRSRSYSHKDQPGSSSRPPVGSLSPGDGMSTGSTVGPAVASTPIPQSTASRREIAKHFQVKGLSLDLFETTPLLTSAGVGIVSSGRASSPNKAPSLPILSSGSGSPAAGVTLVSGPGKHGLQLSVELHMVLPEDTGKPIQIMADVNIGAVRLQLLPSHAVCLSALQGALDRQGGCQAAAFNTAIPVADASPELWASSYASASASMQSAVGHWGRRSLIESIMMPNCEGVVAHSLESYVTGAGLSYGDASEFHDACSRFGSLASSLVNSVTQTGTNLMGYVAASGSAAVGGAVDWMGVAAAQPSTPQLSVAQLHPPAGSATLPVAAKAAAAAYTTVASTNGPALPSQELQPIVNVRAHISHAAFVLCYGVPSSQARVATASLGTSQPRRFGSGTNLGGSIGKASVRGAANGTTAAANAAATPAAPLSVINNPGAAGSLVVELQELSCDVLLDETHGNVVSLQAGQLQVYEQLPAALGVGNGMSPAEWGRIPEVLPQAPHRFRPTQPAPARLSESGNAAFAGVTSPGAHSPKLGARTPGRNTQFAASSAVSGVGTLIQTWPILLCASTYAPSEGNAAHPHQHSQSHSQQASLGKAAGNRHAAQPAASHGGVSVGHAGAGGHTGCLRLRASWGGGTASTEAMCGYGRYGGGVASAMASYDLSVEVLPFTVWLSLPLIQRVTEFAAPLAVDASHAASGGSDTKAVRKPAGPLARLCLTVVAPHICVLLALVPSSPQPLPLPRPPGAPVFIALDVVSAPHPSVEPASYGSHNLQGNHYCPYQSHHPQHAYYQIPYGAQYAAVTTPTHSPYIAAQHGTFGGSHQGYGGAPAHNPSNCWGGAVNHPYGGVHGYPAIQPGRRATHGPLWASPAWVIPEPPPLLTVYQAPATDRLIPSQVTAVDLAAGVIELLLVRTAVTTVSPPNRSQGGGDAARVSGGSATQMHQHLWSSAATDAVHTGASWTSKSLLCLSPAPPQSPAAAPSSRPAWDTQLSKPTPPTGPADVPLGCGLHLHVCIDPGIGVATELVSEAWGHVTTHAQDRWADLDGEGGAWEERSSFRSVAFHERCRTSSASFVHVRAPKAQLHLTRADLHDLAALVAQMQEPVPAESVCPTEMTRRQTLPTPVRAQGPYLGAAQRSGNLVTQACVLLEIGLGIQLHDDNPSAVQNASLSTTGAHASAAPQATAAPHAATPQAPLQVPTSAASSGPQPATAAASGGSGGVSSHGLGLVLGGSRVAMYELVMEELTVFRATNLASQAGCNVTSVHAHGVTLLGHLEQQHQQLQQQLQQAAAAAAAQAASTTGGTSAAGGVRAADSRQRTPSTGPGFPAPQCPLSAAGLHGNAVPRKSLSDGAAPYAICLVHCPATAAAGSKQPSYIEYVCVEGWQPPTHQANATGRWRQGANSGGGAEESVTASQRTSGSGVMNVYPSASRPQHQQKTGDPASGTALHSVLLQGVTISTDHGYVTMDWAVQLGQLMEALAGATPQKPPSTSQPCEAGTGGVKGRLAVNIVDLALRHEPMDYPTVATATSGYNLGTPGGGSATAAAAAATGGGGGGGGGGSRVSPVSLALIIEAIHVGLPLGVTEQVPYAPPVHTIELHSLTLHLAAADERGPGWTACDARAIREPLLQASGYHRVLQETSIKVVAKQRRYPRRPKAPVPPSDANIAAAAAVTAAAEPQPPSAAEEQFHTTLDVEITNQHLLGMLTVESATLLAHFAMQAGTLMTARQAAAVAAAAAAAGAPPRRGEMGSRPASGGPEDLYWDAASENGSSAIGGGGMGSCTCGFSEAGGDAAETLLTALLLEEVEENAFRRPASPPAGRAAGPTDGDGAGPVGLGGGWYTAQGSRDATPGRATGLAPGGLILIDDFFPVNHQGEYDEDLMLVQHPPKGGCTAWRRDRAKMELEGTWYGPDEGPDKRRSVNGYSLRACGVEAEGSADPACIDSGSGVFLDGDMVLGSGALGSGGLDVGSEDPDIDDLLMSEPRDGGVEPRHVTGAATGSDAMASILRRPPPSVASVGSSAATRSSCAPTWRLQEDYVRVPRKSDEDGASGCGAGDGVGMSGAAATGGANGADAGGPEVSGSAALGGGVEQPPPVSRITFKDLSGIWVMHTTRAVPGGSSGAAAGAGGHPSSNGAGCGGGGGGQQVGRVELVIEGLGLLLENYGPGGHLARHMKLTVHDLEIRDCALEVKQQQAAAAAGSRPLALAAAAAGAGGCTAASAGNGGGWVRVLGYRAMRGRPRDSRAPLVALALTAVRPNPAACDPRDEEFRLAVALLPLRLKLNQDILSYLTWYGTSVSTALRPAAAVLASMQAALSELDGCEPLPPPYFQRAQIRGFSVMLDYRPRRVDIGALADGRMLELLNLVPLGGVDLVCKPLRLAGVQGWDGLGAAVLREWLNDIARTQAHKFIAGLAPVNAVVKVGSAVATLVSAPARHLARREGAAAAGRQLAAQLRRTSATFAYRLVCEAMVAGRKAASGAGKALARVGNNALGAYGAVSEQVYDHNFDEDGGGDVTGNEDGSDGGEEEEGADGCGALRCSSRGGPRGGAEGTEGGLRRSRSAGAVMRKGLSRAAMTLGTASQHVASAAGLQRGVSSVARVLSAAAINGVSAAAPASAALQGQLKGTLRSMQHALRAQILHSGGATTPGPGAAPPRPAISMGGYPMRPRPKED